MHLSIHVNILSVRYQDLHWASNKFTLDYIIIFVSQNEGKEWERYELEFMLWSINFKDLTWQKDTKNMFVHISYRLQVFRVTDKWMDIQFCLQKNTHLTNIIDASGFRYQK